MAEGLTLPNQTLDITGISDEEIVAAIARLEWEDTRRPDQAHPDLGVDWTVWNILSGRGWGKTRTGAETAREWAWNYPGTRGVVIAPTANDLRSTIFEGDSGLVNVVPRELIVPVGDAPYHKTLFEMTLINGSTIKGMSAENPERLRGPQFHWAWCDELAAWKRLQATWDMLMFTMRLKTPEWQSPRIIVTTTPKPLPLIRKLAGNKLAYKTITTKGSSLDNLSNLAPTFAQQLLQYEGTQLGRQEIHGEVLAADEGAVIRRSWWHLRRHPANRTEAKADRLPLPPFERIIMSLDTAFTEESRQKEDTSDGRKGDPDYTACTVWGYYRREKIQGMVLLDAWHERLGLPELIEKVKSELKVRYGSEEQRPKIKPLFGPRSVFEAGMTPTDLLIEDKGSGISLRQILVAEGIPVQTFNPGNAGKLERLHAVSHLFHKGMVAALQHHAATEKTPEGKELLDQPVPWAEECIEQVSSYRGKGSVEHDDYVDSVSQALLYIAHMAEITVSVPKDKDRDERPKGPGRFNRHTPAKKVANPYLGET